MFITCKELVFGILAFQVLHLARCRYVEPRNVKGVYQLACSDNATCINDMTEELIKGVRENRTVNVFDMFIVEPMKSVTVEGRSNEGGLARFFNTHSFKFDFGRYGIRVAKAASKSASLALEIVHNSPRQEEGRGRGKKIMQVMLPLLLGVKAASTLIVAIAAVALLTFKAFVASKLALIVTIVMVVKKFLSSFSGSGAQHNPYMYSQYPIDFPSAGAHPGYSMGVSGYPTGNSAYAAPELYGVSGLSSQNQDQSAGLGHAQDATGQYSQSISEIQNLNASSKFVPTAGKRWDGIKKKPMYYDNSRYSEGYQEYEP